MEKAEDSIIRLRDKIVRECAPSKIILFSEKHNPGGELSSVKLCVIIGDGDAIKVEKRLYVEIESEVPFDVLVYTKEQWGKLLENDMSFAASIKKTGRVLYAAD